MSTQPATVMNELISQINTAMENGCLTEQALIAFEDEAHKLRSANIAEGDMILGIIAAYRGDLQKVHKRFKNARAFNGAPSVINHNYGFSLFLCGDFGGAIQVLAPDMENDEEAALLVACSCLYLGLETKAEELCNRFNINKNDVSLNRNQLLARASFIAPAIANVEKSFVEDRGIWQSLSER